MASVRAYVLFLAGGKCEHAYFAAVWVDCGRQSYHEWDTKGDLLPCYKHLTTGDRALPVD